MIQSFTKSQGHFGLEIDLHITVFVVISTSVLAKPIVGLLISPTTAAPVADLSDANVMKGINGAPTKIRTRDLLITNQSDIVCFQWFTPISRAAF